MRKPIRSANIAAAKPRIGMPAHHALIEVETYIKGMSSLGNQPQRVLLRRKSYEDLLLHMTKLDGPLDTIHYNGILVQGELR